MKRGSGIYPSLFLFLRLAEARRRITRLPSPESHPPRCVATAGTAGRSRSFPQGDARREPPCSARQPWRARRAGSHSRNRLPPRAGRAFRIPRHELFPGTPRLEDPRLRRRRWRRTAPVPSDSGRHPFWYLLAAGTGKPGAPPDPFRTGWLRMNPANAQAATRGGRQGSADKFIHSEGFAAWERWSILNMPLSSVNAITRNMLWCKEVRSATKSRMTTDR